MKNYYTFLPLLCLPLLSGCPMGDRVDQRYKPAETAPVMVKNAQVCFTIKDAEDYQPAFISIAPRTTPYKGRCAGLLHKEPLRLFAQGVRGVSRRLHHHQHTLPIRAVVPLALGDVAEAALDTHLVEKERLIALDKRLHLLNLLFNRQEQQQRVVLLLRIQREVFADRDKRRCVGFCLNRKDKGA